MTKIPFDTSNPDIEAARRIMLARLRDDQNFQQLPREDRGFNPYVEYKAPIRHGVLTVYVHEAFWQLLVEGILTPGSNSSNLELPHFRITSYGAQILAEEDLNPHDPSGYLDSVRSRLTDPDDTVMAYLEESVKTFRRGLLVASAMMLGVAAERVFDLVCESMHGALVNSTEKTGFGELLQRFGMKPKLDWMQRKLEALKKKQLAGIPDDIDMAVTVIYNLLRNQRNELGHPREAPPKVHREEVFGSLLVFPSYYEKAQELQTFLAANQV